ncbi:MAG: chemotaxis protein CheD [Synergistaceae bacterium]|nr:chemotaxis protein CheD [Synergistaceae bacterium]MBQ3449874.1 chemotaxis protein CheD [Synergistaceae bacterium]MBQ3695257.1 chemotaxis protein CheD [Synergistaceae bacterium]MBQ6112285.1 chemotaxis protein CheD [Synergistaceae bacterium]MBR0069842.1 chemotaxis protein CheD [Synergistaceae bacterium]
MAENTIVLGMADLMVIRAPIKLVTLGLGSCIGLVVYDSTAKVAGMAHIMLPNSRGLMGSEKVGKFADTAVPALIDAMEKQGAVKSRIKAKLAGGAQMFALPGMSADFLTVGAKNVTETKKRLSLLRIALIASDTGGNKGRTIEFSTSNWMLKVKTLGKGVSEI